MHDWLASAGVARPTVSLELGPGEQVVAEVPLGADVAVLTDRRLVVAGRDYEQSLPLAHVALVRVRFERSARGFTIGVLLLALALVFFSVAGPIRAALLNQSTALESAVRTEHSDSGGPDLARTMQALLDRLAKVAAALPIAGWLVLLLGIARIVLALIGRTVVTVFAGGGEIEFSRRGRAARVDEFVKEVGRHLPAPGRR